jgi:dystrophin
LKSQVEFVLKQGRSIVEKKQVDDTDELTRHLDQLKHKYNELGSRVTNGKNELEKAFKLAKKFRKEYNIINDFMGKIDGELRKIEQKPLSKNYNDELEWIKNTKIEINKVGTINLETMRQLKKSLEELVKSKSHYQHQQSVRLSGAVSKIQDIEQKVSNMQRRIDDRAVFLHEQAKKLDESYQTFLNRTRQVLTQTESLQHELIEAERVSSRDTFDKIEREVNTLLSDVEMIRAQATELCSKSEQYCKVVETELRTVITNFEDLNRRLNLAQVSQYFFYHSF